MQELERLFREGGGWERSRELFRGLFLQRGRLNRGCGFGREGRPGGAQGCLGRGDGEVGGGGEAVVPVGVCGAEVMARAGPGGAWPNAIANSPSAWASGEVPS